MGLRRAEVVEAVIQTPPISGFAPRSTRWRG